MRGPSRLLDGGRYEVRSVLGRGGMATVYEAWDHRMECKVAIKVLDTSLQAPSARERFRREARLQANLKHPSILSATDWIDEADTMAMVMEYIDGPDLAHYLAEQGSLPLARIAELMLPILDAIEFAHAQGVLHRDLKPSNVLLRQIGGRLDPVVTDFGVAKMMNTSSSQTQIGARIGTPEYMPPEQLRGQSDLDERADVYALGIMLRELATGVRPMHGPSGPPPPSGIQPALPPAFDALVAAATALDRRERLPDVAALSAGLRGVTSENSASPPSLRPITLPSAPTALEDQHRASPPVAPSRPVTESASPLLTTWSTDRKALVGRWTGLIAAMTMTAGGFILWWMADRSPSLGSATVATPAPPKPLPASAAALLEHCTCSPQPSRAARVSCSAAGRSRGSIQNQKLGTDWIHQAEALRSSQPHRSRELARLAAEAFTCVAHDRPDHAVSLGDLSWALELLGDHERAQSLQIRLRQHTSNRNLLAASYFLTARLACARGDPRASVQDMERSLSLKESGAGVAMRRAFLDKVRSTCL